MDTEAPEDSLNDGIDGEAVVYLPTAETYRNLTIGIATRNMVQIEASLVDDAEATVEVQDQIIALSLADLDAAQPIFLLFDEYGRLTHDFLCR